MRVPIRGGNWNNGANAGVFYTNLNNARSNSNTNIGFRSALLLAGRYFSGRSKEHPRKASTKGACFRPDAWTGRGKRLHCRGGGNATHGEEEYTMSENSQNTAPELQVLDNCYEEICEFDSLYQSHLKARRGKRYRDDVLRFSDNLEENLIGLENDLLWQSYAVGRYRVFYVREPKLRLVMALQYRDRIVQWAIYRKLYPFYDRQFIEDSYACRQNKGSHKAADRLQYWLRQVSRKPEKWYYLKLDISKYFYRVDHAVLLEILSRRIKDQRLMWLLETIINCEDQRFGLPAGYSPEQCTEDMWLWDVGMPIGNLTSQLFANLYLNELDQYCKHTLRLHYYIRYMDDIVILSDDKKALGAIKEDLEAFLRDNLHLDLNQKTTIRPISLGVDFVGYHMWATHRKLKKQTARRIIRNVKRMSELIAAGEMSKMEFYRVVASYRGVLQHCDSYGLRRKLNAIFTEYARGGGEAIDIDGNP